MYHNFAKMVREFIYLVRMSVPDKGCSAYSIESMGYSFLSFFVEHRLFTDLVYCLWEQWCRICKNMPA